MGKRSHSSKSRETSREDSKKLKLDKVKKSLKHKHKEKHKKRHKKDKKRKRKSSESCGHVSNVEDPSLEDRLLRDRAKAMAPMTKEEWDKRQSTVRRVVDEETGRTRLVKGDGEILEEIVSKQEHSRINKMATKSDGQYFQKNMLKLK